MHKHLKPVALSNSKISVLSALSTSLVPMPVPVPIALRNSLVQSTLTYLTPFGTAKFWSNSELLDK